MGGIQAETRLKQEGLRRQDTPVLFTVLCLSFPLFKGHGTNLIYRGVMMRPKELCGSVSWVKFSTLLASKPLLLSLLNILV